MRVIAYTRVSTEDQEDGTSPEEQIRITKGLAMQHGLPDPEVIFDQISGTVPLFDRKDGSLFEFHLEKGDAIIVTALDRLFRSSLDGQQTIDTWRKQGVKLIIAGFGDLNDPNNPMGKLVFDLMLSFSAFERNLICKRLHDGRKAKRAKGGFIGGEPPWGHYVVGEGKKAHLRQKDWYPMAVRRMREFRNELKWTYDKIVVKLNDIPLFDPISRNTVRRILVDEKGKWTPAIGKEKFVMTHQVKESITRRRARGEYR
jgi:DNA invertase Pin-like site-specific DNA recombinase